MDCRAGIYTLTNPILGRNAVNLLDEDVLNKSAGMILKNYINWGGFLRMS